MIITKIFTNFSELTLFTFFTSSDIYYGME